MKFTAIPVNIMVCHGCAIPIPAGTRTRPIAMARAKKVSKFGKTANAMIAAKMGDEARPYHKAER